VRDFFALNPPLTELVLSAIGIAAAGGFVIEMGWRITGWVRSHQAGEPREAEGAERAED
jgi:hypothetical protein